MFYYTKFNLTTPVSREDFHDASAYLLEDDMVNYFDYLPAGLVKAIDFVLVDNDYGYVVVETDHILSEDQLDEISDFISGQASDGLGEGFEQTYYNDDEMCSFDWETNRYKLKLICALPKEEFDKLCDMYPALYLR